MKIRSLLENALNVPEIIFKSYIVHQEPGVTPDYEHFAYLKGSINDDGSLKEGFPEGSSEDSPEGAMIDLMQSAVNKNHTHEELSIAIVNAICNENVELDENFDLSHWRYVPLILVDIKTPTTLDCPVDAQTIQITNCPGLQITGHVRTRNLHIREETTLSLTDMFEISSNGVFVDGVDLTDMKKMIDSNKLDLDDPMDQMELAELLYDAGLGNLVKDFVKK